MSDRKRYVLTDEQVSVIKRCLGTMSGPGIDGEIVLGLGRNALTPLNTDEAVERMARMFAGLEPGEPWPTNEELGGGPTGTRDDEYRHECMDRARAALNALLNIKEDQ